MDDVVIDWSKQSLMFQVDADGHTAAQLLTERTGIELTEAVGTGEVRQGTDASGAKISSWASGPSAWIWVEATGTPDRYVAALSGPPLRLTSREPHPSELHQRNEATWARLLPALSAEGWQVELQDDYAEPIVLVGRVPTGEEFRFAGDDEHCGLEIGSVTEELQYDDAEDITPDDAVRVLRELHQAWLTR